MSNELEVFDLDALVKPVARVKIFKEIHDVLPGGARVAELLAGYIKKKDDPTADQMLALMTMREVASEAVPSMTMEEIKRLDFKQLTAITSLCTEKIDEVRQMITDAEKNVGAPPKSKATSGASAQRSSTKSGSR